MVRIAVTVLLLSYLLTSCKGDRPGSKNPNSWMTVEQTILEPIRTSTPVVIEVPTPTHPGSQPIESTEPNPINKTITAIIKTLNTMQDVSSLKVDNPLRMEGIVITNFFPKQSIIENYNFDDLIRTLDSVMGTPQIQLNGPVKILTENRGQFSFNWRARLVARDSMNEDERLEIDRVYSELIKNPSKLNSILYPVSLFMSTNFYQKEPTILKKSFYLKFVEKKFPRFHSKTLSDQHLKLILIDREFNEAGEATLQIIDPENKEENKFQNYKLVLSFKAIGFGSPIEQVAILKMAPVKFVTKN